MCRARREAVTAAAKVMASKMTAPTSKFPCSSTARTMPTNIICTRPRASDIAVSRSTRTANRRHRSTTAAQSTMAPAAWAIPRAMSLCKVLRSLAIMEDLLRGADRDQLAGLQNHCAVGDAMGLRRVVRDNHAGHLPFANDAQHEFFDAAR